MSLLSRRDFFVRFGHSLKDQVDLTTVEKLVSNSSKSKPIGNEPEWLVVGKISEMKPGTSISVSLHGLSLVLRADAEGVWLSTETQRRLAIRLGPGGVILANPGLDWPRNRILSHASGEPIDASSE